LSRAFRIERADLGEDWDRFVRASEAGTLFSLSGYLRHIEVPLALYRCYNKGELRAAIALVEDGAGGTALHDFIIYNGLMFAPPANRQNRAQRLSEQHEIAEFAATELAQRYGRVMMSLSPAIADIRAFLWLNYGANAPQYRPSIRYTSVVSLAGFAQAAGPEQVPLFAECAAARRQEIRYAIRDGVVTRAEFDAAEFVDFYALTLGRQGVAVEGGVLEAMRRLLSGTHEAGLGRMYVSRTADGRPGSMAYMGIDGRRAYYVFGVSDPELRDSHTGTAVLWDAFRMLAAEGATEVDLEGVNSPRRGWFKLSFGGSLAPYYELQLDGRAQESTR